MTQKTDDVVATQMTVYCQLGYVDDVFGLRSVALSFQGPSCSANGTICIQTNSFLIDFTALAVFVHIYTSAAVGLALSCVRTIAWSTYICTEVRL